MPAAAPPLPSGTRVLSTATLRGVPKGMTGKVIHVQGLTWTRYWVLFDNGLRVGTIDRSKLATLEEWERQQAGGGLVAAGSGAVAATSAGDGGGAGDSAAESVGGVPGYLLERSKKARERWAAKAAG
jgi:hypothetical protein